jgi:hypothetical protein
MQLLNVADNFQNVKNVALLNLAVANEAVVKNVDLAKNSRKTPCRIWSPTRLNIPHPLPATQCLYKLYFDTEKGGGNQGRGVTDHKAGSKIPK